MMDQWIYHNSQHVFFRTPFGAVPCGQRVDLRLELQSGLEVDAVILRFWQNNQEMQTKMNVESGGQFKVVYQTFISVPDNPGWVWYHFLIKLKSGEIYYYGNNEQRLGGEGQVYSSEPPSYQITVYRKEMKIPSWFRETVMYQIFVDRFCNGFEDGKILNPKKNSYIYSNWLEDVPVYRRDPETGRIDSYDFFGGNLLGVLKKLPYLKELGIKVIYFNPIFEAISNHKYDTADYHNIDAMFGDNQLFAHLCQKAKEMGINILLDGVFSHTGSDSIYFNKEGNYHSIGAYQSKESPYYPWYRFSHYPDQYESWWGIDVLPNVEELEPTYQDFIIFSENSIIKHWMRMGVKGWRLDVVDELPDQFLKNFYRVLKAVDPDSILLGEVWEDASNKVSYGKTREYLLGDELDSVMNYPFRKILLDFFLNKQNAQSTHRSLMSLYENYPLEHFYSLMNLIGSHDVPRVLTLLGEAPDYISKEEQAHFKLAPEKRAMGLKRLKMMVLWQMTFPGVPSVYYGDEAGLEGYADPLNRGTYPWGAEDKDLLDWFKEMVKLRNRYSVLKTGEWFVLLATEDVYGYARRINGGKDIFGQGRPDNLALIFFNRHQERELEVSLDISHVYSGDKLIDLLNGKENLLIRHGQLKFNLPPLTGKILMQRDEDNGA